MSIKSFMIYDRDGHRICAVGGVTTAFEAHVRARLPQPFGSYRYAAINAPPVPAASVPERAPKRARAKRKAKRK